MLTWDRGKGARDRYVPLPTRTLNVLRERYAAHRNPTWIFPASGRGQNARTTATAPIGRSSRSLRTTTLHLHLTTR